MKEHARAMATVVMRWMDEQSNVDRAFIKALGDLMKMKNTKAVAEGESIVEPLITKKEEQRCTQCSKPVEDCYCPECPICGRPPDRQSVERALERSLKEE